MITADLTDTLILTPAELAAALSAASDALLDDVFGCEWPRCEEMPAAEGRAA